MPRHYATGLALIFAIMLMAQPAGAVVKGTSSSLGSYTVRLVGPYFCSGVAIGRRLVVTAAHCARRSMRVHAGGGAVGIASVSRSAVLDDGRRVSVSGDAAILTSDLIAPWRQRGAGRRRLGRYLHHRRLRHHRRALARLRRAA